MGYKNQMIIYITQMHTWKCGHVICYCVQLLKMPPQDIVYHSLYTDHVICRAPPVLAEHVLTDYAHPAVCTSSGMAPAVFHPTLLYSPGAVMIEYK